MREKMLPKKNRLKRKRASFWILGLSGASLFLGFSGLGASLDSFSLGFSGLGASLGLLRFSASLALGLLWVLFLFKKNMAPKFSL